MELTDDQKRTIDWVENMPDEALHNIVGRHTGKSTRIVDELIQDFFNKKPGTKIRIIDHYPTKRADEHVARRMLRRLEVEHNVTARVFRDKDGYLYTVREFLMLRDIVDAEIERRKQLIVQAK